MPHFMAFSIESNPGPCYLSRMETFIEKNRQTLNYQTWLTREFTNRCNKNPKYSIRAFADLLKMNSSTVSQILSGKRQISAKMIKRFCDILGASPKEENALIKFANLKNSRNQIEAETLEDNFQQLTLDAYALISDWYHYAILELTFVQDFQSNPRWISNKLGITAIEANIAIERLKRLELIEEANGKLTKTEAFITNFSDGVTSNALKNLQRSILKMALDAIDNTPQEEKDITSMTFAIDETKMSEAKKCIKKFRREMSQLLESGKQTRVYNLGIQLYPISKK